MAKMKASIKDIAIALGVSKATVSCILSGKGEDRGFSQSTIKRVKDYANSINYRPNLLARGLSLGKSNTLGMIVPSIEDTFYAQIIEAVSKEAERNGYMLIVSSSSESDYREYKLIEMLKDKRVDGLIVCPLKKSNRNVLSLVEDNIPFVFVDRYYPEFNTNYVIVNNRESSSQLVTALINNASNRIAFITTDAYLYAMNQRFGGYKDALEKGGLKLDERLVKIISKEDMSNDIEYKMKDLLSLAPQVDAIYFATHYLAVETIRFFINSNIDYRKRFKMACFHTTTSLDVLAPEMSIALMPIGEIGKKAVELLECNIGNEPKVFEGVVLKNTIIK